MSDPITKKNELSVRSKLLHKHVRFSALNLAELFALDQRLWNGDDWNPAKEGACALNMSAELKPDLQLEIAYLLLIDVVGYSKLLVNEQIELMQDSESYRAKAQNVSRRRE